MATDHPARPDLDRLRANFVDGIARSYATLDTKHADNARALVAALDAASQE